MFTEILAKKINNNKEHNMQPKPHNMSIFQSSKFQTKQFNIKYQIKIIFFKIIKT